MADYTSQFTGEEIDGLLAGSVQTQEQELTEPQQMQARKNLGLYGKETSAVITFDGNYENYEHIYH